MATENTETRDVWFVLFSAGDGRFNYHGWTAFLKKCEKVGVNPNPDSLRDYGVEL